MASPDPAKQPTLQNLAVSLEEWESAWTNDQAGWHEEEGNTYLKKFFLTTLEKVLGHANSEGLTVFLPLCGKTPDLMYFYNLGCTVVGLEFAKQPIDEFFVENKFEEIACPMESVRMSADKRMYMAQGDLFSFTKDTLPIGVFDVIWDRGSFEAISREDRRKYAILLTSLLKEDTGMYLMHGFQYKREEHDTAPNCVFTDDLKNEFRKLSPVLLDTQNMMTEEALSDPGSHGSHFRTEFGISEMSKSLWLMQYKKPQEPAHNSLEYWDGRWQNNQSQWHEAKGNQALKDLFPIVWKRVRGDAPMADGTAFLPLCGKSQDLFYFYNLGFRVVGVEIAQKAIDEFFSENQLKFESVSPNITQTVDGRLSIVQGDLYSVELPVQKYDVIWDRGSLQAINACDREKYAEIMMSALKHQKGIHLLITTEFDKREYAGPPNALSKSDVKKLFSRMSIENLESYPIITEEQLKDPKSRASRYRELGLSEAWQNTDLIQHK